MGGDSSINNTKRSSFEIIRKMNVIKTDIEGVLIIEPRLFRDARGYFFESFIMLLKKSFSKASITHHDFQEEIG